MSLNMNAIISYAFIVYLYDYLFSVNDYGFSLSTYQDCEQKTEEKINKKR